MPTSPKTKSKISKPKRKFPKFTPAPEALKTRFAEIVLRYPEAEPRKMFGYPCAFVNGRMFVGTFADSLMLRLSETDRAEFLKLPDAKLFEPMPGRPMNEYVQVPRAMLDSDKEMNRWLTKSLAYAAALPPKVKKAKQK